MMEEGNFKKTNDLRSIGELYLRNNRNEELNLEERIIINSFMSNQKNIKDVLSIKKIL